MRDIIFLLKRTSLSSPHRLKFLSQAHFSLSHISPHPNNKNTHTFHISPISSSKHPSSTTFSSHSLPPSHSNTKCHKTHPNISYHYHQYAPSPTLFSSFSPPFPTLTHSSPYLALDLSSPRFLSPLFYLSVLPPLLLTNPPFPIFSLLSNKSPYLTKPQSSITHPNNKNTHTFHIFPISSSKHPYSTTYSTLFLSLLFPISTFLSPYRIQIPNATKHIPISPTTIISTLPLPLFCLLSQLAPLPTLTHSSPYLALDLSSLHFLSPLFHL